MLVIQSKKTDYNTKIGEIENKVTDSHDNDKYIIIQEFTQLTSENVTARLKQATLESKSDIANFVKKKNFDNKQNELNELPKI